MARESDGRALQYRSIRQQYIADMNGELQKEIDDSEAQPADADDFWELGTETIQVPDEKRPGTMKLVTVRKYRVRGRPQLFPASSEPNTTDVQASTPFTSAQTTNEQSDMTAGGKKGDDEADDDNVPVLETLRRKQNARDTVLSRIVQEVNWDDEGQVYPASGTHAAASSSSSSVAAAASSSGLPVVSVGSVASSSGSVPDVVILDPATMKDASATPATADDIEWQDFSQQFARLDLCSDVGVQAVHDRTKELFKRYKQRVKRLGRTVDATQLRQKAQYEVETAARFAFQERQLRTRPQEFEVDLECPDSPPSPPPLPTGPFDRRVADDRHIPASLKFIGGHVSSSDKRRLIPAKKDIQKKQKEKNKHKSKSMHGAPPPSPPSSILAPIIPPIIPGRALLPSPSLRRDADGFAVPVPRISGKPRTIHRPKVVSTPLPAPIATAAAATVASTQSASVMPPLQPVLGGDLSEDLAAKAALDSLLRGFRTS